MSMWRSAAKVAAATVLFALVHSLFASRAAKEWTARRLGERNRNGLYRAFFLGQSILSFAALAAYVLRLPERVIYRMRGLPALMMVAGQVIGLSLAVYGAAAVGLRDLLGVNSVRAWLRGDARVPPEPEAQGPRLDLDEHMHVTGPFKWSRHPLNLMPLAVFWLSPLMTERLLAFNIVATVYLVLGSLHEERRLRAAYGAPYAEYQHGGVPFYLPLLHG
jgi:hypothetical protein